ncbi:MAG TPA: hypothetical protein CFH84_12045, partial [Sulfurimonas sp. UBA12504]
MRLTVDQYSKHFKMSKEMIQSKLRAKKLNYIIENSQTYIIVTQEALDHANVIQEKKVQVITVPTHTQTLKNTPAKPKATVAAVLALYQRENKHLKDKILKLE